MPRTEVINNNQIPEFKISGKFFLEKPPVVLYGQSGTGKSKIIVHMLHELKPYIDQVFVVSPMEPSNNTYKGIVPKPLIHTKLTVAFLDNFWQRQEMLSSLYKECNKLVVLESLFRRLHLTKYEEIVDNAKNIMRKELAALENTKMDIDKKKNKKEEITKDFSDFFIMIFKKFINESKDKLSSMQLSAEERFTLEMINFNHRTVLILDDCAADLQTKEFKRSETFTKIFYMGRHLGITTIISCQDPTSDLIPNLRKNALASIFTTPEAAECYFSLRSNGYAYLHEKVKKILKTGIFINHQKLIFIREGGRFERIKANLFDDFSVCNSILAAFCTDIEICNGMVNTKNPYFKSFADIYPAAGKK